MKCPQCGSAAQPNAQFCSSCGGKLPESPTGNGGLRQVSTRRLLLSVAVVLGMAGIAAVIALNLTRPPAHPPSNTASATPEVTATPVAADSPEPITTPEQGSSERKAMMDAIRKYSDNELLIFVVKRLFAQSSTALAEVHPTTESDDGVFGRQLVLLLKDADGWRVDDSANADQTNESDVARRWAASVSPELLQAFFGEQQESGDITVEADSSVTRPDGYVAPSSTGSYVGTYVWSEGQTNLLKYEAEIQSSREAMPIRYPEKVTLHGDGRIELTFGDSRVVGEYWVSSSPLNDGFMLRANLTGETTGMFTPTGSQVKLRLPDSKATARTAFGDTQGLYLPE